MIVKKAIRLLSRQLKFRQAISHAIDRNALGSDHGARPILTPVCWWFVSGRRGQ